MALLQLYYYVVSVTSSNYLGMLWWFQWYNLQCLWNQQFDISITTLMTTTVTTSVDIINSAATHYPPPALKPPWLPGQQWQQCEHASVMKMANNDNNGSMSTCTTDEYGGGNSHGNDHHNYKHNTCTCILPWNDQLTVHHDNDGCNTCTCTCTAY